ncbi:8125_t:CDS:1, partial [Diversispora eburnea]
MSNRKKTVKNYNTTVIDIGKIDSKIHYGPFSQYWWISTGNNENNTNPLIPIRIDIKILTKLNKYDFIITILKPDTQNLPGPRYQVNCELKSSEICTSSSVAITSLYQQIFNTKTKFSGPLVMDFDQQDI